MVLTGCPRVSVRICQPSRDGLGGRYKNVATKFCLLIPTMSQHSLYFFQHLSFSFSHIMSRQSCEMSRQSSLLILSPASSLLLHVISCCDIAPLVT